MCLKQCDKVDVLASLSKFFARVHDGEKNIQNLKAHQYFIVDCCSLWNFKCNTCIIIQLK